MLFMMGFAPAKIRFWEYGSISYPTRPYSLAGLPKSIIPEHFLSEYICDSEAKHFSGCSCIDEKNIFGFSLIRERLGE
jgi:hypothetical protein